jgi:hypothetical protein
MNVVTTGLMITVAMGTELSKIAVGRVTVTGGGAGVGDDAAGVGVAVGGGVGPGPVIVMRPLGVEPGSCTFRSVSMKIKLSGYGCQTNGLVAPGVLLTLTILRLHNVPDPFSGMKSFEKADMRRVLSVPGPVFRIFAVTFQLVALSPAASTHGAAKVTTAESKVKSPWKQT